MTNLTERMMGSLALAATVLLSQTSCSSFSKIIEKPKVTLQSVAVKDPNHQGTTIVFGLLVENPNSVALEVDELTYDVDVANKRLTSGKLANGAKVPAKDKAVVEIPVAVKYSDLFDSVLEFLKQPQTPYVLKGAAKIGPFSIPFEKKGELKISEEI